MVGKCLVAKFTGVGEGLIADWVFQIGHHSDTQNDDTVHEPLTDARIAP